MPTTLLPCLLYLLASTGIAAADSLFDNLALFQPFAAQTILGTTAFPGQVSDTPAMSFVPTETGDVTEIDLAIGWVRGTNDVNVMLAADNEKTLPGSILASWSLTNLPTFGTLYAPESILVTNGLTLNANVRYWLIISPGASDTWAAWNRNATDAGGVDAFSLGGTGFGLGDASETYGNPALAAFAITGLPVVTELPEPKSAVIFLLCAIGIYARYRHRTVI